MDRFRIATRLMLIVAAAVAGLLMQGALQAHDTWVDGLESRKREVRNVVDAAYGMVDRLSVEAAAGNMTTEAAKALAAEALSAMRYGAEGTDYLWVNDVRRVIVMHAAKPELAGRDMTGSTDPNGVALFDEFVRVAQAHGSGFVGYAWPKPGEDAPVDKVSFVRLHEGWGWVIGSGVYVDNVVDAVATGLLRTLLQILLVGGVVTGVSVVVARGIVRPLRQLTRSIAAVATGETDVAVPCADRRDELGEIARAVEVFRDNARERQRLERQQATEREAESRRAADLLRLTSEFDRTVGEVLETLSGAAGELEDTAGRMDRTAAETAARAGTVAGAAEATSTNVQAVAAASEQMSGSVVEIGRQVQESNRIADRAVQDMERTNREVDGLDRAAQRIGEVVGLISDIASQTNLLALNATIEAARAGEAGKGFAVVAGEVKSLATQTAKATGEIGQQIAAIQAATGEAVTAIQGIGATIRELNAVAGAIAAAVEQQGATTREIARNVQQAADGTAEVSRNIGDVNAAAGETGAAARRVLESAGRLSRHADGLRRTVDGFLADVRAA